MFKTTESLQEQVDGDHSELRREYFWKESETCNCWTYIPIVQPTRCTSYLKLFILVKRSTCFVRSFRPLSRAQNCVYSNGICQTAAATCRYRGWNVPFMFHIRNFELLMMDGKTARNMYSVLQEKII